MGFPYLEWPQRDIFLLHRRCLDALKLCCRAGKWLPAEEEQKKKKTEHFNPMLWVFWAWTVRIKFWPTLRAFGQEVWVWNERASGAKSIEVISKGHANEDKLWVSDSVNKIRGVSELGGHFNGP